MIRRLGYLKSDNKLDETTTGFYSDDDDVEESKGFDCDSLMKYDKLREVDMRYRYKELNDREIEDVCNATHYEKVENMSEMQQIEINYTGDLIRQRTARDPRGRGSKMFKDMLRGNIDVVCPEGKIIREAHPSSKKKLSQLPI
jgi:hypothetical protein